MLSKTLLSVAAYATAVHAHGYVKNVIINGVYYAGYDVTTYPYMSTPPTVIAWKTTATDLGFVAPDAYNSSDIICHTGSENAGGHAQVAAGDDIYLQWSSWPDSHKGPVMSYLANCGDAGCESVDKTTLEFFKIDEVGLVDGSTAPGTYGDDQLIDNNNGWLVHIPSNIASGNYVLRHEMIALHSAGSADGAQNYPQCFNLQVTGGGSDTPSGTLGTALYSETDPGILVNIYVTTSTYVVPGPTTISGASQLTQSTSAATSTGSATTGTGTAAAASATSTAATSAAAGSSSSTVKATSTAASASSSSATSARSSTAASTQATTFSTATRSSTSVTAAAASSDDSCSAPTVHTVTVTA